MAEISELIVDSFAGGGGAWNAGPLFENAGVAL